MPDVNVSIDEFLASTSKKDIHVLIDYLVDNGWIKHERIIREQKRNSIPEQIFNKHLAALSGKWNRLTEQEENSIISIGKKFL